MLATRSVGWRLNTPWTISEAIVSWMARSETSTLARARRCCRSPNVALAAPRRRRTGVVAAVAEVERDRDRRLGEAGPHRVVELVAERPAGAVGAGHRGRADVHDARAALEQRVDLGDGARRGRPATASATPMRRSSVVEAPVLLEPAVEGREARHRGGDVVAQRLLDAAAERREQQRRRRGPARPSTATRASRSLVLGPQRLDLHERAGVDALGDLAAEQRVEAARHDDRVEGRVRDEAVDLAADQQLDPLAVLHGPHAALA